MPQPPGLILNPLPKDNKPDLKADTKSDTEIIPNKGFNLLYLANIGINNASSLEEIISNTKPNLTIINGILAHEMPAGENSKFSDIQEVYKDIKEILCQNKYFFVPSFYERANQTLLNIFENNVATSPVIHKTEHEIYKNLFLIPSGSQEKDIRKLAKIIEKSSNLIVSYDSPGWLENFLNMHDSIIFTGMFADSLSNPKKSKEPDIAIDANQNIFISGIYSSIPDKEFAEFLAKSGQNFYPNTHVLINIGSKNIKEIALNQVNSQNQIYNIANFSLTNGSLLKEEFSYLIERRTYNSNYEKMIRDLVISDETREFSKEILQTQAINEEGNLNYDRVLETLDKGNEAVIQDLLSKERKRSKQLFERIKRRDISIAGLFNSNLQLSQQLGVHKTSLDEARADLKKQTEANQALEKENANLTEQRSAFNTNYNLVHEYNIKLTSKIDNLETTQAKTKKLGTIKSIIACLLIGVSAVFGYGYLNQSGKNTVLKEEGRRMERQIEVKNSEKIQLQLNLENAANEISVYREKLVQNSESLDNANNANKTFLEKEAKYNKLEQQLSITLIEKDKKDNALLEKDRLMLEKEAKIEEFVSNISGLENRVEELNSITEIYKKEADSYSVELQEKINIIDSLKAELENASNALSQRQDMKLTQFTQKHTLTKDQLIRKGISTEYEFDSFIVSEDIIIALKQNKIMKAYSKSEVKEELNLVSGDIIYKISKTEVMPKLFEFFENKK